MQFHNREKLAYCSALTILLSYAESMLPHFLPFFKYGLGNSVILLCLSFSPFDFVLLLFLKSLLSSFISGILFTPFFVISIAQSLASGFSMYFLNRLKGKFLSIYGISIFGSALSAFVQIFLASLYTGKSVFSFLGLMLIFSLFSGCITAFISEKLVISEKFPEVKKSLKNKEKDSNLNKKSDFIDRFLNILSVFLIIFTTILVFFTKNIQILILMFIASLIFQSLVGRRIFFVMHFVSWLFIITFGSIRGSGEIIFKAGFLTLYKESLIESLIKALRLSTVIAISQTGTAISFYSENIFSLTLKYFSSLLKAFEGLKGNFFEKMKAVFLLKEIEGQDKAYEKKNFGLFIGESLVFTLLFLSSFCSFNF